MEKIINNFLLEISQRNTNEPEFMQAVSELAQTVIPYIVANDIYHGKNILMRMAEPERVISPISPHPYYVGLKIQYA